MPLPKDKEKCFQEEMKRWKLGELHSGRNGPVVKSKKQAIAIAMSSCYVEGLSERLAGIGFSSTSLHEAEELLNRSPNWDNQFRKGRTLLSTPKENKITVAPSLPGFDIDNDPGKQPGDQGKLKDNESMAIFPVSLPKGDPQQGPRSKSGKALSGF